MFSDLPCNQCEKIVIEVESVNPLTHLNDAPNTFDPTSGVYAWKEFDLMKYALIPRAVEHRKAWVELFLCIDEDDLDDMDLLDYVNAFLKVEILPRWDSFSIISLAPAYLATPTLVGCWRVAERATNKATGVDHGPEESHV